MWLSISLFLPSLLRGTKSSIGFAGGAGVSGSGSLLFFCSIVPERMRYNLNPFVRNNG